MTAVVQRTDADALLAAGIAQLGLTIDGAQRSQLLAYVELLAKWNKTYNLTAIREPERMVTHHLLDALAVLPHLAATRGLRVLDVGSGGGVPGIPLAIARPDWRVALVDASHKKCAFLTQAAIELRLRNVEVHATRVEDFRPETPFDVVVSRAFSALGDFAACSWRLLAPNGQLVAMKGLRPVDEIAQLPAEVSLMATTELAVPGLDAARHLVVMERNELNGKTDR